MDKFGIFNLLNSFFSLGGQKNNESNSSQTTTDFLSGLLSSLKNKPDDNAKPQQSSTNSVPHPLQENMLSTINSHDALVKRVKQKETRF